MALWDSAGFWRCEMAFSWSLLTRVNDMVPVTSAVPSVTTSRCMYIGILHWCYLPRAFLCSCWLAWFFRTWRMPPLRPSRFTDARYDAGNSEEPGPQFHHCHQSSCKLCYVRSIYDRLGQTERLVGTINASLALKVDIREPILPQLDHRRPHDRSNHVRSSQN